MDFNIQALIDAQKKIITDAYGEYYPKIQAMAEEFYAQTKPRLEQLAADLLLGEANGGISEEFFLERLKDEPKILAQQFESFKVAGLVIAQDTMDKSIEVFTNAILDFLTPTPVVDPDTLPIDKSLSMGEVPEEITGDGSGEVLPEITDENIKEEK